MSESSSSPCGCMAKVEVAKAPEKPAPPVCNIDKQTMCVAMNAVTSFPANHNIPFGVFKNLGYRMSDGVYVYSSFTIKGPSAAAGISINFCPFCCERLVK